MESQIKHQNTQTIAAISTPPGVGGIAVIRVSGPESINIVNSAWKGVDLAQVSSHTAHLGKYYSILGDLIDEAVATIFIAPASFTGENVVELSVHGSVYIQKEILNDLVNRGAKIAAPGEFTQRAFLNGKLDLAQAEGVADLIASSSKAAHDMAINQTKGKFSQEFNRLRDKLIEFASLIELELDFAEEEVEFADRSSLIALCKEILLKINALAASYSNGAVLKNGVPVVIAGIPNAGKSSLLNLLIGDEKAIVTDVPGTTRDTIEDTIEIDGILYRFIDTAGLRETDDIVEGIGVERAYAALEKAYIVVWLIDPTQSLPLQTSALESFQTSHPDSRIIPLLTKSDLWSTQTAENSASEFNTIKTDVNEDCLISGPGMLNLPPQGSYIPFSSQTGQGLSHLLERLKETTTSGSNPATDIIVTNARHFEALNASSKALQRVVSSLGSGLSTDLIAQDIREAISHISLITGSINSDTLLHSIFSRFCIGK